ncbi:MAG TPA: GyrI-like domain-containing protein [Streptosporangiaceae bacterium]|nr:GyrI-like domain-containing protein [Streptosporangiaceae bacterium]
MTNTAIDLGALHKVRKGSVDFVDIPELGFLTVEGSGRPGGAAFTSAVQALYTVSYGARFLLKKERGAAPPTMPLEAQWWVDDPEQRDVLAAVALGSATMTDTDQARWRWRAMIVQPDPVDVDVIAAAIDRARAKTLPALRDLRYERWAEGRCAQLLHVGPYSAESPSIVRLHEAIAAAGYRPRGRHHEIYLSDPRRCAPGKLRTILRHPVAPPD